MAEQLERRLLLTAVTIEVPVAGTIDAPSATDVAATFDVAINPATATHDSLVVHRESIGKLTAATAAISTDGQTVTVNPSSNLLPGEIVKVTATSGIQSTTGDANESRVWEFRARVSSGSGQFVDSGQRLGTNQDGEVGFGDLDADGDLDAIQGGNIVWINDGNGNFFDSGQRLGGVNWDLADIDGDGDQDIIEQNNVYLNDGNAVFTGTGQDLSPAGAAAVEVGDLDGDGDIDVMVGQNYTGNVVWLNNGSGNFSNTGQSLGTSSSAGIGFGDFDGDGDLDAYVANNGPANRVYMNDGSGIFTDSTQQLGGFQASVAVDVADLDGDGDLDALVANDAGGTGTVVWLNNGDGIFIDSGQRLNPGTVNMDATLGDIDADGDLDVYATGWYNPSEIWTNDGEGLFTQSQSLPFPGNRPGWIGFADIDGDGDLDAFEGNRFAGGARVFINQNLEPSVSLSVDDTSIVEGGGTATVTATLSEAHTLPVTIELSTSGTATADGDYTLSSTQIVVAAGDTTGTVTITAVQDSGDEPNEDLVVGIASITNAQAGGNQQVTVTIIDDDEPAPDVTLSVDNATISEDAGVATFSATLSAATDLPVTVDLGISGSATATDDYLASAAQITISAGDTTGSITVTAVQDAADEPDETVIVEITGVTNGNVSGTQQATTTIVDDDEPVMPDVTLSVDNSAIAEAGGIATFTANLSEATTGVVIVDLALSGTATEGTDYSASGTQISIAAGATSGSVTVTAIDDEENEPNETVIADISAVTGGNEAGMQQATTTITNDDAPPGFTVTSLTTTPSGFVAEFSTDLDPSALNVYDTQNLGLGEADVTLVGSNGPVRGSVVVDARTVTFIKAGGPLEPDAYLATLRSGDDGFKDTQGRPLDGDNDGTGGDDYSQAIEVGEPAAGTITVGIPDFTRGPGQDVNLPANTTTGIPITISDGDNVRAVDLRIAYDATKLSITGATVGEDAPAGATVIVNTSTPGLAILVFFSSTALPAGSGTFINLAATVPTENAGDVYATQQVLDLHAATISDGNDNEASVLVDDAVQLVSYFSDVSGNGRTNAADASQIARFAALIDTGFSGSILTDPILVGDVSGNGRINAADASLVAQFAALIDVPVIPPIPGGILLAGDPIIPPGAETAFPSELPAATENPPQQPRDDTSTFRVVELFSAGGNSVGGLDHNSVDAALADDDNFSPSLEDALADIHG